MNTPASATSSSTTNPSLRPNLYATVHKGLRAAMMSALHGVGSCDGADDAATLEALDDVTEMLELAAVHLEDEELFIHTAMEQRRPGSTAAAHEEHGRQQEQVERLRRLVDESQRAGSERTSVLARLYRELSAFVADNFVHMLEEETAHNALLWELFDDGELGAIEGAIVAHISPRAMGSFQRWMIPAMNHAERVDMLAGMRAVAPPEAFAGALAIARSRLDRRAYEALTTALGLPRPS